MVINKFGDYLYNGLVATLKTHLESVAETIASAQGEIFLRELKLRWDHHNKSMQMIRDILMVGSPDLGCDTGTSDTVSTCSKAQSSSILQQGAATAHILLTAHPRARMQQEREGTILSINMPRSNLSYTCWQRLRCPCLCSTWTEFTSSTTTRLPFMISAFPYGGIRLSEEHPYRIAS